ncbi:MAG: PEP-CTERM sorting domain-containing protein, partial [Planctomycetota bacterium]
ADLDLVLLNWGDNVLPAGFDTAGLPGGGPFDGLVSQNELDGVLLNWGDGSPPTVNAIPEPGVAGLLIAGMVGLRRRR